MLYGSHALLLHMVPLTLTKPPHTSRVMLVGHRGVLRSLWDPLLSRSKAVSWTGSALRINGSTVLEIHKTESYQEQALCRTSSSHPEVLRGVGMW